MASTGWVKKDTQSLDGSYILSLEHLYQSSPFIHHCKGKSMTYLEMDIVCSRFFLFLKYGSHPMIAFLFCFCFFFFWLTRYWTHDLNVGCFHCIPILRAQPEVDFFWYQMKAHIFLITSPKFLLQIHYTLEVVTENVPTIYLVYKFLIS